jgi:spermidine/putrescine transport system permease protein
VSSVPSEMPRGKGVAGSVVISRAGKRLLSVFFVAFLIYLYIPTVLLLVFSFNDSTNAAFPLVGFTTSWYRAAFHDQAIRSALRSSLELATCCAIIATTIATMVSYPLARRRVFGRSAISALMLLPLVVPTVVLGVSLLLLFQRGLVHVPLGFGAVLIGHIIIALPFCVLLILPRLASIDKRLEEAAQDLGASGFATFRLIVFPLILPAILSSLIIAFVVSIDELIVASFLNGRGLTTLPIFLYSSLKFPTKTMELIPVATVLISVSFCLVLAARIIAERGARRTGL